MQNAPFNPDDQMQIPARDPDPAPKLPPLPTPHWGPYFIEAQMHAYARATIELNKKL